LKVAIYARYKEKEKRIEAASILRLVVDTIVLRPVEGKVEIDVQGDLAGILTISAQTKNPADLSVSRAFV
jgi:site-specific DNA recombinase